MNGSSSLADIPHYVVNSNLTSKPRGSLLQMLVVSPLISTDLGVFCSQQDHKLQYRSVPFGFHDHTFSCSICLEDE